MGQDFVCSAGIGRGGDGVMDERHTGKKAMMGEKRACDEKCIEGNGENSNDGGSTWHVMMVTVTMTSTTQQWDGDEQ
ncbi:hypothetical protein E2C01_090353 [Portunus trituberculatus]|uniref:Uncharacterized protein n=1 Tax=Portunus trituberculatus TaxID=210409 RepID=A0A5B7JLM0_PORTR|nr:hypothetical protein [Portunus trituberculatus]